ncbi:hypothetical protein [Nocardioides rubriscoriae]|uniref:hypothetical protein n=1 Tax=Nocardioides rubriscoriae TaxID=642762 RepID=UPI0011DFA240|nr:hypothetical protein [Nocardioides rubriscoriae]
MRATGRVRRGGGPTHRAAPATTRVRTAEVHLEEVGPHSRLRSLLTTLGGSYGSTPLRFVARACDDGDDAADDVATGATFPGMRVADLDEVQDPDGVWLEIALARLDELDVELCAAGWRRCITDGRHWWSRTYAIW